MNIVCEKFSEAGVWIFSVKSSEKLVCEYCLCEKLSKADVWILFVKNLVKLVCEYCL